MVNPQGIHLRLPISRTRQGHSGDTEPRVLAQRRRVDLGGAIKHQRATHGTQVRCTAPYIQFIAEDVCFNRLGVLDPVGAVPTEPEPAGGGGTKAASYVGDPAIVRPAYRIRGGAWIRL